MLNLIYFLILDVIFKVIIVTLFGISFTVLCTNHTTGIILLFISVCMLDVFYCFKKKYEKLIKND